MTVKELCEELSVFDDDTPVVVHWERDSEGDFMEIDNLSIAKGSPGLNDEGKAVFQFDSNSPVSWLFINVGG
jgi:hypothetical protein